MFKSVELLDYPDVEESLYTKSVEIDEINEDIINIAHQMAHIMYQAEGIGISAPQIGINKRLIVIDCTKEKNNTVYMINPTITWKSKESLQNPERCLSYPGLVMPITRPEKVKVEGLGLDGQQISLEASGLCARTICHEVDHLNGVPFVQRVSRQVRRHLIRKWLKKNA